MARVACIGSGNVGRAWAVVFARAGHEVALYDADPAQVAVALPLIARTMEQLGVSGDIRAASSVAEAVAGAIHVQESVREDTEIKRAVMSEIAAHAPMDCVIASSTSALPGSTFMTHIPQPERALVAHPVNPPSLIPLVELCGTGVTSDDAMARSRAFMDSLGMKPVTLTREIDGFLLNRLQYTLVAEALHLVGEGYCTAEDIDRVMTDGLALRWLSIGPFATAHLNATAGFKGFVGQLGPMMRRMGEDARTDYDWDQPLIDSIHDQMAARFPVDEIPDWQAWRDGRILAARRVQDS
ncbi:3-hydroxyacyl-CoA dehydrogenase NAD-binding domain-containing protein [Falsirhodobacter xinxiangensis]|uniref:3-hydroxyacyl-CoA dehydrogenase NAD-binding domain-containing protein n=1 Tax=Falsirhodobacter xinxiangensis TaxID=2530049 RepID=UPI0010A9B635|nr:3-hydroxyacyl-CoA dehydrogenase NAD-binding domain-containing protein [Rhodobacter xinxiangensis]